MENTKRKEGYYWVKEKSSESHIGRWLIAKWNGGWFEMFSMESKYDVFDFEEIDERQIIRTEPCKTVKELRVDLSKLDEIEKSKFKRNAAH